MAAAAPRRRRLPPPPREEIAERLPLLIGAELVVLALEAAAVAAARCCRSCDDDGDAAAAPAGKARGLVALAMRWHCVRVCISQTSTRRTDCYLREHDRHKAYTEGNRKKERDRQRERRVGEWVGGIESGERYCRRGAVRVGSAAERQLVINGILLLLYPHHTITEVDVLTSARNGRHGGAAPAPLKVTASSNEGDTILRR